MTPDQLTPYFDGHGAVGGSYIAIIASGICLAVSIIGVLIWTVRANLRRDMEREQRMSQIIEDRDERMHKERNEYFKRDADREERMAIRFIDLSERNLEERRATRESIDGLRTIILEALDDNGRIKPNVLE